MGFLRLAFRSLLFGTGLLCYIMAAIIVYISKGFSAKKARPVLSKIVQKTSKAGLVIFNVKVRCNLNTNNLQGHHLIVSNHLTYLDILILSSYFDTSFVTSQEMKETPVLGQLCLLGGCFFVERRKRSGIRKEIQDLSDSLKTQHNIVIFPEATSTNGEAVIKFRRPLFQAAFDSDTKILPVCLNYRKLDGEQITLKNRDKVFWYGDMGFFPHAMKLLSHEGVEADLTVLNPLDPKDFPDKNTLADQAYAMISLEYQNITHSL